VLLEVSSVFLPAIVVTALAPVYYAMDRSLSKEMLIGPCLMAYVFHLFGYAIGPVGQILSSGHLALPITAYEGGFVLAQWGAVLGLLTFPLPYWLFFRIANRNRALSARREVDSGQLERFTIILAVLVIAILTFGFTSGAGNRLGGFDQVTILFASLYAAFQYTHQIVFFFLGYVAAKRGGVWPLVWAIAFASYTLFFFLDGGRGTVAMAGLLSATGWVAGGAGTKKVLLAVVFGTIVFVPFAGVVNLYRNVNSGYVSSLNERWSAFEQSMSDYSSDLDSGGQNFAEVFFQRATAQYVDRVFVFTPSAIPFAGFESLENVIYVYTPRILKPDRPTIVEGDDLAIRYGAVQPGTTGSPMTAVGEGYRRFGWIGIPLWYGVLGTYFGTAAGIAWSKRNSLKWLAFFVFVTISASEAMISTVLWSCYVLLWVFPKYFLLFMIVDWISLKLSPSRLSRTPGGVTIVPRVWISPMKMK
jgi:hypothetical protein